MQDARSKPGKKRSGQQMFPEPVSSRRAQKGLTRCLFVFLAVGLGPTFIFYWASATRRVSDGRLDRLARASKSSGSLGHFPRILFCFVSSVFGLVSKRVTTYGISRWRFVDLFLGVLSPVGLATEQWHNLRNWEDGIVAWEWVVQVGVF